MRKLAVIATLLAALTLAGCSAPETPTSPTRVPTAPADDGRADVDWSKLPDSAQRLIDEAEAAKDCDGLQGMFDVADQAGFTDEMKYIDEALSAAGCY